MQLVPFSNCSGDIPVFFFTAGIPAVMVAMSLSIAAGKDGIQSFIDDE